MESQVKVYFPKLQSRIQKIIKALDYRSKTKLNYYLVGFKGFACRINIFFIVV